ncbi:alanine aminotransferas-like protein [Xylona heveae TC161]|uniref:Glutamate pyruvate transaminase n=1 Tax=Xylona heveae (strain CBS 132557 / TC161) TaxID=1328760 RepID=A0A165FIP3_XYLHT|nr:alanine aminotransferas-like protein [Xylona heveae TC161]KZF21022.1 alanine aminotransferas-like protein [Xylona heveae TC161]
MVIRPSPRSLTGPRGRLSLTNSCSRPCIPRSAKATWRCYSDGAQSSESLVAAHIAETPFPVSSAYGSAARASTCVPVVAAPAASAPHPVMHARRIYSAGVPWALNLRDFRTPTSKTTLGRRNMSSTPRLHTLNKNNINQYVVNAKYAVRGELPSRAEKYRQQLAKGYPPTPPEEMLPFHEVIFANIGNPQHLDQKPITFFRQVLSLLEHPELLKHEDVLVNQLGYKIDVIDRARWLLHEVTSVGAYSQSAGVGRIRESIARFIEKRDGYPADPQSIYLSAGASAGVMTVLQVLCASPKTGVLVPIPQYPLYTATLALLNAQCVPYYLEESHEWATDHDAIGKALQDAKAQGTDVRAIVVINPGNPTGQSLSAHDVESVLELAAENNIVVIADEVYQTNVFQGEFHSFKKTLRELQKKQPGKFDKVELVSLHSTSKGMVGECGHRGGYFELINFDPEVVAEVYKLVSISLCPPVVGQCLVELMVNPPQEGDPSYPLYKKEYDGIFNGLHERATALHKAFTEMEGVECNPPQGAMYLFPTIHLPPKAVEQAKKEGRAPDEFYAFRLLDATGVCVIPGSGFGQKPNTLHFRTTFLAPGTDWVNRITKFHKEFMDEFRS